MKLVVCAKAAATVDDEADPGGAASVDPDDLEWALNEWDAFALEAALQVRDAAGDGEVVVVTAGGEEATDALLECLAKGADRAVRIALAGGEEADPITVARLLAAAVRVEDPALVLCGVQSSDWAGGVVGTAVAGVLDLPHVAVVKHIEVDAPGGRATVHRELEGGLVEEVRIGLPALLTVQTGINEPRYANLRAIKQARDKPLALVTPDDLGVALGRPAADLRSLDAPAAGDAAEMLDGPPDAIAERLLAIVRERLGTAVGG